MNSAICVDLWGPMTLSQGQLQGLWVFFLADLSFLPTGFGLWSSGSSGEGRTGQDSRWWQGYQAVRLVV